MTATVTDLFCGAGGSSLGAQAAGARLVMAANHWSLAIDVHQSHFPDAGHDCADISQVDPRRYPQTNLLLASPECTNHSQARGVSRRQQDPTLWDAPDPAAERSRATMWDVPRFAEQMNYDAIVVENVVEASKWVGWRGWRQVMADLGYESKVLSHNAMHHGVAQSRDRIFVVFWRKGLKPDLELELEASCSSCDGRRAVRQAWKNGRSIGRYRQQWVWACTSCGTTCEPDTEPAASIIDWALPCPRIGDRARPLAQATRDRVLAGLRRYGFAPVITAGAGNVFERTPGNRAKPLSAPLPVQTTTLQHALATPPGYDDSTDTGSPVGLLMRNNTGGAEMVTPLSEPARTITTSGHQSLLVPYYGTGRAHPATRPLPTVTTRDRVALVEARQYVDDCGFRMLEPHEVSSAMAFPGGYIPGDLSKRDQVKLAGNAVPPPMMTWATGRLLQALEMAA